jgi:plastocyanin
MRMRSVVFTLTIVSAGAVACVSERTSGPSQTAGSCTANLPAEAFGSTVVIIRNFAFSPAQVTVARGSKVTWVNCGAQGDDAHTSTADGGGWRSDLLAPGESFTTTVNTAGSFPYHCEPHPTMRGTVTVQ